MARREGWDCGRNMCTCRRAVVRVEASDDVDADADAGASVSVGGRCCPSSSSCHFLIAMRSCCTSLETEKVLSVSMIATQESLPPRDDGRIAAAVKR